MSSSRPDRRRRQANNALAQAQEVRGLLQEQFFRVDQLQRDIGTTVAQYAALLPDRARSTGVVPGWKSLDDRAHQVVADYLALLDQHDPVEDLDPYRVHAAATAFERGTPPVRAMADELERFLDSYGNELGRLGEVRAQVERRIAAAQASVTRAEEAWRAMRAQGVEVPDADEALARARVAARKLGEIGERLGPDAVEEPASVVERLAEQAQTLAVEVPQRLATLGRRIPSLATRIEAVETRRERTAEHMSGLRREFSHASWKDLAATEADLEAALEEGRASLERLRDLHEAGETTAALHELALVEQAVERASDLVDAPRRRLERLREVKRDPQHLFERARFALRDTRLLLRRGSPQPWGGRLDALAHELVAIEGLLEAHHPDYWQVLTRTERLHEGVDRLVADFRASQART